MVPSLEYLARNVVIETAIRKNKSRYKYYVVVSEHVDQYADVVRKKFPLMDTHKIGIETLLVISK